MDAGSALRPLKSALEASLGVLVFRRTAHGHSECADIVRSRVSIRTVFDIGANVGAVAQDYLRAFPEAVVHCFEPVPATFEQLSRNLRGSSRVVLHREAVGSVVGSTKMFVGSWSPTNSLVKSEVHSEEIDVSVTTIDSFCAQNGVGSIDLLKVDVEGFDMEVLRGGAGLLSSGRVRFVLVEVTPNRSIEQHVPLAVVQDFLEPLGFQLYGLYDQHLSHDGRPLIKFANALFRHQSGT